MNNVIMQNCHYNDKQIDKIKHNIFKLAKYRSKVKGTM